MQDDLEQYLPDLDGLNLTQAQKMELLRIVQRLVESLVDQAFGVHPVQLSCGNLEEKDLQNPLPILDSKVVHIHDYFSSAANEVANDNDCNPEESKRNGTGG